MAADDSVPANHEFYESIGPVQPIDAETGVPISGQSFCKYLVKPISTVLLELKQAYGLGYSAIDKANNVTRALSIVIIFLALVVAGREIPEISKLADDTSNDGQIVVLWAEAIPAPVSQRAKTASAPNASNTAVAFSGREDGSPRPGFGTNGQDLLQFLTIRRT
jgi:hypothetical protein